ncbi:MAG: GAF domain-containing protein [Acidobacteriota bacterium]
MDEAATRRTADTLAELDSTLARARQLAVELAEAQGPERVDERVAEYENALEAGERDREELTTRMVEAEHQLGRLMNLYVATFQLHATLDPAEVQATIAEIAVDLLGAERFVLLLRLEGSKECEVAFAKGLEHTGDLYANERYSGGDPLIDAALDDGVLRLGPDEFSEVIAAVPLRVQDAIVGALVVLKLFDHKAILRAEDRDLLDLLAAHAASALFAARVYSNTDRKLRTLESLVQLVRGT